MERRPSPCGTSETKDLLRLLFRRDDIVAHLRDEPHDIRSLTDVVDVSRPTVHRSLKALQQYDVVAETTDGYDVTPYGKYIFDRYRSSLSEFETLMENRELLLGLNDSTAVPHALLDGGTYTRAVPFAHEGPISAVEEIVRDATVVRGFSPVVVNRYVSLFHEQLTTDTLEAEIITSEDVFEYVTTHWEFEIEETMRAGLELLVVADPLPFGLVLVEEPVENVCIIVYDNGTLRGVIQNDSPSVVEWAHDLYDSWRRDARKPAAQS